MRAIGFSELSDRRIQQQLVTDVILSADSRSYTANSGDAMIAEFSKDFAPGIGITVCGEFDAGENFTYDYYYPYLRGSNISSVEDISVERHADKESYAGVCDDIKVGVSLIFYLQNMIPYIKAVNTGQMPIKGTTLSLSALSLGGTILLPLYKDEVDKDRIKKQTITRNQLMNAAKAGDEEAIETLTLEDMDIYSALSKRIQEDDMLTLIDTYFMPYGVECDQYSVLGEILELKKVINQITEEEIWILKINCNDLEFDVCINDKDLCGEPQVGRRFKGTIWMQGRINYPE